MENEPPFRQRLNIDSGDTVHIIGNPEGKLWRWTAGFFEGRDQGMLQINAGTYGGNSGGPVLNARGRLIGIVALSNRHTDTWAVPVKYVDDLLSTLAPRHIVSISNEIGVPITFYIKGEEVDEWKETVIKSGNTGTLSIRGKLPDGYPQVRFDEIANDGKVTFCKPYVLRTHKRYFGVGVETTSATSGYKYYFDYNSLTEIISLRELEESNQ
ncbi:MAG: serine protease [Candidatus Poribacteria bacterium]|nr:serine protease [Candidatus Poribacteria bacterium]